MNLLDKLNTTFIPKLALMVYESAKKEDFEAQQYYIESHQIGKSGEVLEGKPLRQETIQEIVDMFFSDQKDRAILSGNVPEALLQYKPLSGGKYRLVWCNPPQIRMIHFAKHLKLVSNRMWFPGLVYVVDRNELMIYAYKKSERANTKTKLYRAPFHNVSDDGTVCLGSAKVRKPSENSFSSIIKYWEDLFWLSEFSHLNGASNPTKSPLDKVYKTLLASKTKKKWSEIDELKESRKQMQSILK